MARTLRVAIIGAGIGGLAAAAALRKLGCEAVVYERGSDLGEVGAGLQIGPNGVKVLHALGLEHTLEGLACEPNDIVSLAWNDAHLRFRQPLKAIAQQNFGARYITAHRADLHRLLQERVPASTIHLNARCTGVETKSGMAIATFEGGKQIEADVIVGADGIRSTVRECLYGAAPARYTGQMGWRGIVPIEYVPSRVGPGRVRTAERRRLRRLDRPDRACDLLSDPRRRTLQHVRRSRVGAMGRGILDRAEQQGGNAGIVCRLERGPARHARESRARLQVGHLRPRSVERLDQWTRHA